MSIQAEKGRGLLGVKAGVDEGFAYFFLLQPKVTTPSREALPNAKSTDTKVGRHQVSAP